MATPSDLETGKVSTLEPSSIPATETATTTTGVVAAQDIQQKYADPFAPRPGHELAWSNVNLSLTSNKTNNNSTSTKPSAKTQILSNVSGVLRPGQLSCIMGESGAGKSSLLNILAGKVRSTPHLNLTTDTITLDGVPMDPCSLRVKQKIAFVGHHDALLATATPREAIQFSARLRLSTAVSDEEIDALATSILDNLKLTAVADAMIGGEHVRGLSSGETRRTSLALQLVVRPSILFLDEITSGLDSHSAATVMKVCQRVAHSGTSVLMTIHQPSSRVFDMMDHLILMKAGRCLYQGPASETNGYFAERGHAVPDHFNPSDWILEVSQTNDMEELEKARFFEPCPESAVAPVKAIANGNNDKDDTEDVPFQAASWNTELFHLIRRDVCTLGRDFHSMKLRFIITVLGAGLIAVIFNGVGTDALDGLLPFTSCLGALFLLIFVTMIGLQLVMLDAIDQRQLFVKEFTTNHYRVWTYAVAKLIMETFLTFVQVLILVLITYWSLDLNGRFWIIFLVIYVFAMIGISMGVLLACAPKDPRGAKELIPIVVLPQVLLSGYFMTSQQMPEWIAWAQKLMPLTYAFRLLLSEEFAQCVDEDAPSSFNMVFCTQYLESQYATGSRNTIYWMALLAFFCVIRVGALGLLRHKAV